MDKGIDEPVLSMLQWIGRQRPLRAILVGLMAAPSALQLTGCATPEATVAAEAVAQPPTAAAEETYGIRVEGLRLSAAGSMLDFRYRVLDPQKAAPILNGKFQPYLLDEAHGAKLGVPDTPVLGRIRQTSRNNKILTDRTYFIMFGNPGKALQSGDKVTLLLGQVKITDLTVQ
jgi:hypothetical protein